MTLERRHLRRYAKLFLHRRDLYARQRPDGSYFLVRRPVRVRLLERHLVGELTCGWYGLKPDNTARWVALDADADDGLVTLQQVWEQLRCLNLTAYLENSRRGGHLWVFVEPMQALVLRTLLSQILDLLEIKGMEIYPRQDELVAGGVGSLMRGPLGVHQLTGQRYGFLDPVQLDPIGTTLGDQLDCLERFQVNTVHQVAESLARVANKLPQPRQETPPRNGGFKHDKIEELKAAVGDLYVFVSQFVELDARGRGSCPFHPPDRHPSFAVNREEGYWVCFHETNPETGRYLGGDAIEFYQRLKKISFKEAVRELAEQYGVTGLPF